MSAYDNVPWGVEDPDAADKFAEAVETRAMSILVERAARDRALELEAGKAEPIRVHHRADLAALRAPQPVWGGWLYTSTPALLSAPGGVGKSALLLGLAAAMWHGLDYLGSPTKQGRTLYIAGEGERSIDKRLHAWEQHNGVPQGSTEIDVIYGHPLTHGTLQQVREIVAAGQYDLVVGDTIAALSRLQNENDNAEVSRFLRAWQHAVLGGNPHACPVLVHHVTEQVDRAGRRSQKSRGASAFRDDHDTVIMLEGTADSFRMTTEVVKAGKQKDAAPRTLDSLALRSVGPSVVIVQQTELERLNHHEEVGRLVGLMVPGNGYGSTELQEKWGLATNKGRYQALRTEALELGLIIKSPGNKGRYSRV